MTIGLLQCICVCLFNRWQYSKEICMDGNNIKNDDENSVLYIALLFFAKVGAAIARWAGTALKSFEQQKTTKKMLTLGNHPEQIQGPLTDWSWSEALQVCWEVFIWLLFLFYFFTFYYYQKMQALFKLSKNFFCKKKL